MFDYISSYLYPIARENKEDFKLHKFKQNNKRILLISAFLIFEQLFYAVFISKSGTILNTVYYGTALIMFIYTSISAYFYFKQPKRVSFIHKLYQVGIGVIGLTVAVIRIGILPNYIVRLPTIYIAVVYGMAVIFYFNYIESFFLYLYGALLLVYIASTYQPILLESNLVVDALSNIIIAWLASMIIFKKFVNEFINQKKIEDKNEKLNKVNAKLKEISDKDRLTGIYNRRKLEEILSDVYYKAERYNKNFSLILFDLDHFKKVNDNYGHQVGDKVLKEISKILLNSIRKVDYFGRWGGEEFLIILPETNLQAAEKLAERLRGNIEQSSFSKVDNLTSSFGVASYSEEKGIEDIIQAADQALYRAKEKGRNRVEKIA